MKLCKRSLVLMTVVGMVLTLIACGSGNDTASQTSSQSIFNTSSKHTPTFSEIAKGYPQPSPYPYEAIPENIKGSTVRFATWEDETAINSVVPLDRFHTDTGLKVELCHVPKSGYLNTLISKIASGNIPDVFVSDTGTNSFPLSLQIAAPINKVSSVNLRDYCWDAPLNEMTTINGNVYFVSSDGSPWANGTLVYYNKRIFADNNLKTPESYRRDSKWTWDAMLECARAIKSLGADYKGIALDPTVVPHIFGTSFIKYDQKTKTFSNNVKDELLLKGLQQYNNAKSEGLLDGSLAAFENHKCGLLISGTKDLRTNGIFNNMDPEDIYYAMLPALTESGEGVFANDFRMYGICHKAPNADAAGYFIRYWLDPDNYDLQSSFLTPAAGQFYLSLTIERAGNKSFWFDEAVMSLNGGLDDIRNPLLSTDQDKLKKALNSVSNKVDKAVNAANALIQSKIAHDRDYYK